jgi:hypothetical protein
VYRSLCQFLDDPDQEFVGVLFGLGLWPLLHLHATSHHKGVRIHGGGCGGSGRVFGGSDGTRARYGEGRGEIVEHTRVREFQVETNVVLRGVGSVALLGVCHEDSRVAPGQAVGR